MPGWAEVEPASLVRRVFATLLFVALLPVNFLIALLLTMSVGRNFLFVQQRSGLGGEPFDLVKFRTMRDLRGSDGELLADEQRVTRIGRLLRKTRLDELPSFWNVARGDMALVGPRPLLPETIESLGERGRLRGTVLPGLTGYAQISGNTLLSLDEKIALDLHYVAAHRWHSDVYILIMTLVVMIFGEKRRLRRIGRHAKLRPPTHE